jgi:transposase
MQEIVRQSVGIDISKSTFTACHAKMNTDGSLELSEVLEFENSKTGFNQVVKWARKVGLAEVQTCYVMEATGIYYEPLAYHLVKVGQLVSVVLPNMVKHFGKSLNIKSKTDAIDARMIARLGVERVLASWEPPCRSLKQLRDLTRLYTDLKQQRTAFLNRLHSTLSGNDPLDFIVTSTKSIIAKLDKEIVNVKAAVEELIQGDEELKGKMDKLQTIKGVGLITLAIIVAETQGFKLIRNSKQLASYAGYDVVERESGSSVKGKTRISKKGNSRIRASLHFPALVASRHNAELNEVFGRI